MDVVVEVKERQTGAFSVGAGFSSVENFLFQAQISKQNFLGRGQNLRLEATLSSLRRYFVLSFDDPYFLDTDWTFGFSAFNTDLANYNFSQSSTGMDLTLGRRFADWFSLAATYRLEGVDVRAGGQDGGQGSHRVRRSGKVEKWKSGKVKMVGPGTFHFTLLTGHLDRGRAA